MMAIKEIMLRIPAATSSSHQSFHREIVLRNLCFGSVGGGSGAAILALLPVNCISRDWVGGSVGGIGGVDGRPNGGLVAEKFGCEGDSSIAGVLEFEAVDIVKWLFAGAPVFVVDDAIGLVGNESMCVISSGLARAPATLSWLSPCKVTRTPV